MKKILLLVAIAALGLASCTDNQIEENLASKPISFNSMIGKNGNLKVAELNLDGLKTSGFTVTALNSAGNTFGGTNAYTPYFNDLVVSWSTVSSKWTYSDDYYWPEDSYKLSFFAYAGDAVTSWSAISPNFPSFNYTIAATAATQKDLVAAMLLSQTNTPDALALTFKHILTQINFSIKGSVSGLKYVVKKIDIIGANNLGTYTYNAATEGGWTAQSGSASYTYFDGSTTPTTIPIGTSTCISFGNGETGTEALMLMPQNNTGVTIKVTYDIQNINDSYVKLGKEATYTFASGTSWEMGKKIRYNISLPVNTNRIELSASVSNWNTETPTNL